ncbi:MAG TPA: hypothetical protein VKR99_09855, partial [Candidatus Eremiobacteraceae bacterium]|nr:hypothetical protein [Candidatus Eremiobacteraceae bacterium]
VSDIWVVASRPGATPRRVSRSSAVLDVPSWSADGTRLSVLGHPDLRSPGRATRLGFLAASGGDPAFVTDPEALNFASVLIAVGHGG